MDSTSKAAQVADLVMAKDGRDDLRKLAEKATPGPWKGDRIDGTVKYSLLGADDSVVIAGDNHNSNSGPYGIMNYEDERYLLAANPARILSLLDQLEAQRKDIDLQAEVIRSKNAWIMRSEAALAAAPASPASAPEARMTQSQRKAIIDWMCSPCAASDDAKLLAAFAAPLPPVVARKELTNAEIRTLMHNYSRMHQPGHYSDTEFDCLEDVIGFVRAAIDAARLAGKAEGSGQ